MSITHILFSYFFFYGAMYYARKQVKSETNLKNEILN